MSNSDEAPLVTRIVNVSLSTGTVPLVTPILKKPGLDANDFKKIRPVSNLPFVSKILERVVFFFNCSLICAQTAYSKFDSLRTENIIVPKLLF